MKITADINEARHYRRDRPGNSWGLVPTMGYLHEGHLSLVRQAKAQNDKTAVTIYVNPTQFAPTEDLGSYPRNLERDLALLAAEAVDLVFTPSDETMYPPDFQTTVTVTDISKRLEGASRPTHFNGVATIVTKLFNIIQPTRAYFGQKDAQQTIVLRQLVRDLNLNIEMVICPIVREADGLAMSSRNAYLSAAEREAATVLFKALHTVKTAVAAGERDGDTCRRHLRQIIEAEPLADIDYVSVADPFTLEELAQIKQQALISLAVFIGHTRLIDNLLLTL